VRTVIRRPRPGSLRGDRVTQRGRGASRPGAVETEARVPTRRWCHLATRRVQTRHRDHRLYATGPAQQEGRGRRNPHTDPRVVAGFDEPVVLEPGVSEKGLRDFRRLTSLLEQPLAAAGVGADKKPVYHLIIAAKKDPATGAMVDRYLSDGQWRDIAETYMDRIGLAPRGDDLGARWVAVRHADDRVPRTLREVPV